MTSPQAPVNSPFGYRSTAREVVEGVDLAGKTVVVTGGYSGIGTETVPALAGAGAQVIVGARRPDQAEDVLEGVSGDIAILPLDLSDPASIDAFAEEVAEETATIDILINNAAIMASPLARDARGYEMQFATNHLGHFQLAARLWLLLVADGGARVVALSSKLVDRYGGRAGKVCTCVCEHVCGIIQGLCSGHTASTKLERLAKCLPGDHTTCA